jgi:uncharacterized membrane-anchored protein
MSIFRRTSSPEETGPGVTGPARLARPGGDLTAGLRAGDVAVIDRPDLDADDAGRLVAAKVAAVINVSASTTGRFPNMGPQTLLDAGIPLIDQVGQGVVSRLRSGDRVRVHDGKIFRDGVLIASGTDRDIERNRVDLDTASSDLTTRLDTLAVNASDHLRREHAMLLEGVRVPRTSTRLGQRPVVVVSDAFDAEADLRGLKRFIADRDPVLIGAGKGADVLIKVGYTPAIVVGDIESLSQDALKRADEVVVTTASGQITTPERLEKHGRDVVRFVAAGDDTDLAILLADANRAAVIVHAGAPPTLVDFLGQGAGLMGAAFVVRLRAASKLIDAKAVGHVTSGRISLWPIVLLLVCGVVAVAVAIATTPAGGDAVDWTGDRFADLRTWIEGLLP